MARLDAVAELFRQAWRILTSTARRWDEDEAAAETIVQTPRHPLSILVLREHETGHPVARRPGGASSSPAPASSTRPRSSSRWRSRPSRHHGQRTERPGGAGDAREKVRADILHGDGVRRWLHPLRRPYGSPPTSGASDSCPACRRNDDVGDTGRIATVLDTAVNNLPAGQPVAHAYAALGILGPGTWRRSRRPRLASLAPPAPDASTDAEDDDADQAPVDDSEEPPA